VKKSALFSQYDDYSAYISLFKSQINDPTYFDLLVRSNAVYYLEDLENPNYIKEVYHYLKSSNSEKSLFIDQSKTIAFTISAIVENKHESMIYMTKQNYNNLYQTMDNQIGFVNSQYTVYYHEGSRRVNLFERLNRSYYDLQRIQLLNHDLVESNEACQATAITDAKTEEVTLLKSVFYLNDYLNCGKTKEASSYLNMFNWLFSIFFNILMIASIVFYSMLIKVIFKARINEIGVFRSVGSTIKDIKQLFFFEVIYIFVLASILTIGLIFLLNQGLNQVFLNLMSMNSRVIQFSGIDLLMNKNLSLINISIINLMVQFIVVVTVILYVSNRSITHVVNTNPIDILREVV
jgi:ABC-type antimicrobial peptide transport system permease subunit